MGNYLGSKHTIGFKPESTPGTPEATVTRFMPSARMSMAANRSLIPRLTTAAVGVELPSRAGWIEPSGSASGEVHASWPYPWYWMLGAVATTTPAGDARLHTITEADDPISLTVEGDMVYGDKKQTAAKISKLSMNAQVGEIATMDLEWLALAHDDAPTLTSTPAYTTDPMVCTAVSVKIDGSQVYTVPSIQIDLDRALEQLPVLTNSAGGQPQLIRRTKALEITGSLDFIDFPTAELTKMTAATSLAIIVELQGAVIATTYKYFLRVTLPACLYTGGLDTEAADSMMTGSAQFKAFYDTATSRQILVESQNILTAITA